MPVIIDELDVVEPAVDEGVATQGSAATDRAADGESPVAAIRRASQRALRVSAD